MDSRIQNLKFYNEELKLKFLDNYDDESQLTYAYILSKATRTEEYFKKDLCTFNDEEISYVLHEISPLNIISSVRYGGVIRQYIDFGISNGYRTGNINPLTGLTREWYKQFIGKKKIHITEDELNDIAKELINAQDILPLYLAFEGIVGENMEEQTTLTLDSIVGDNILSVHEIDKEPRLVVVSDKCMQLVKDAAKEKSYRLKNGISSARKTQDDLPNNGYVLRVGVRNNVSDEKAPISKFVLFRRLRMIKKLFNLPNTTFNNIKQSGMIKMAVDIYLQKGKIERSDLDKIQHKFNASYFQAVTNVVNRDVILNLYGIDINEEKSEINSMK